MHQATTDFGKTGKAQGTQCPVCGAVLGTVSSGETQQGPCAPHEVWKVRVSSVSHPNADENPSLCQALAESVWFSVGSSRPLETLNKVLRKATAPHGSSSSLGGHITLQDRMLWGSRAAPGGVHQGCAHNTALLPLSTLTTCKPEGAQATAFMEELCCFERTFSTFPVSTLQTNRDPSAEPAVT